MINTSVIILNWNGAKILPEYLPSVIKHTNPQMAQVIVVDNHSDDSSVELLKRDFPNVKLMIFDRNYGFADGYNRAIAAINTPYVLLLNSDVAVTERWIEPLVEALENDTNLAAVQPKIRAYTCPDHFEYAGAAGGFIDRLGFPFCRGRILNITEIDEGQYNTPIETFWCSGAALCIRREAYLQIGGLDAKFFAHMEEIDLCWRLRNAGFILKAIPASMVYHLGGGSLPMNHPHKLFLNYRNNLLMLYKNLSPNQWRKTIIQRCCIDIISSFIFTLKGEFKNTQAVYSAYLSFLKIKKEYTHSSSIQNHDKLIYPHLIIFSYYLHQIKKFSQLSFRQ